MGLWRGLLREVISLATWIAAFAIAFLFAEDGAAHLTPYLDVPSLRMAAAFGGLFLITLLLGGLIGSYSKSAGASSTTNRTLTVVIKFDKLSKVKGFSYHASKF